MFVEMRAQLRAHGAENGGGVGVIGGGGFVETMVSLEILVVVETLSHGIVEVSKGGRGGVVGETKP